MPNRVIREALLDSGHYALLSAEAKLLYIHILLLADDFGCVGMGETFLRRRAFHDAPSGQKIASLITELVNADLLRCYDADRGCFAFIPKYGQRLQRQTLKHPKPPESLYSDDPHATQLFNKYNDNSLIPTVGQPLATVGQPPEVEVKKKKDISASRKTQLADGFVISPRVWKWAEEKNITNLQAHFENFVSACRAKGYRYIDWDDALMNAIRNDWAKIGTQQRRVAI